MLWYAFIIWLVVAIPIVVYDFMKSEIEAWKKKKPSR